MDSGPSTKSVAVSIGSRTPARALQRQRSELLPGARVVDVRRTVRGRTAGAVQFGDRRGGEVGRRRCSPSAESDGLSVGGSEDDRQANCQQRDDGERGDEFLDDVVAPSFARPGASVDGFLRSVPGPDTHGVTSSVDARPGSGLLGSWILGSERGGRFGGRRSASLLGSMSANGGTTPRRRTSSTCQTTSAPRTNGNNDDVEQQHLAVIEDVEPGANADRVQPVLSLRGDPLRVEVRLDRVAGERGGDGAKERDGAGHPGHGAVATPRGHEELSP